MALAEKTKEFLAQFSVGSPERSYFEAVLDLLTALNLPITETFGFACMAMLEFATITLSDSRVIGESWGIMGSKEDIAYCLAVVFADIQSDPIWWKAAYTAAIINDPQILETAKELTRQLAMLPIVRDVNSSLVTP